MYYVEMTDTYVNELTYSWVWRYIVKAETLEACMQKVSIKTGYKVYKVWCTGDDEGMYKVQGACIGFSVQRVDDTFTLGLGNNVIRL